ncbi:unnamed protein product [Rotaria magnacalcarata]|uniref:Major facilitator superfamily (MFS) profile domain-containing protein n=1 Tax=Rotaria magnacalcarata TaxID=392030 RepID=A0A816R1A3_9BILA|nr:unnamed protein product [Rotaria magnacalcarata]CAF2068239.1 unnamed protein product [Rotaria magnacalcarata]CAF3801764.1 unnamed protein product [Rotaria magnacalcarata]CAF3807682.1 unnamed protein product [Rotaria magnacalcarata]
MTIENTKSSVEPRNHPRLVPSKRFTLALLVFFAFIVQYSQRVNLPIAIVCMIEDPASGHNHSSTHSIIALKNETLNIFLNSSTTRKSGCTSTSEKKGGFFDEKRFHWTELRQQFLLGAYWAGYIFTQVPGGWLATSIGAKWVYAGSLGTSSLATLAMIIMHKMASTHVTIAFMLRFITGLAHGVLFPATVALWSLWAVPHERSTLASIGFCGTHLGTSITMLFGGLSCRYLSAGWMYVFITSSILGFIWLALWIRLTADSPNSHKSISDHERDYIGSFTGHSGTKRAMSLASIPWKNIINSKPLNALMITHIANLFGLFFFLTSLGKLLTQLLHIKAENTGYILSFGFFLTLLSSLLSGIATDRFVRSKKVTLTNARKISNGLTSFIPVICMMLLYVCDERRYGLGIFTILIFLASSGLGYGSGYVVNFADIVPAYSGVIFGIANTLASIAGLIGNLVAGAVIKKPVLEQWRKLYVMFGIVYLIGGVVYIVYGSAVPRKWAKFQAVNNDAKLEENTKVEEAPPTTAKI